MKFLVTPMEDMVPWIHHGFFTRHADASVAAQALGTDIVMLRQVHSAHAVQVKHPWVKDSPPEADALVTSEKNTGLCIVTADCAPVLFAARSEKVVGAAHAGWKGALGGVLDATVAEMSQLGAKPSDIVAAIGPCIAQTSYEVDDAFMEKFIGHDPDNNSFFKAAGRDGHRMFDLGGYVERRLKNLGIATVFNTAQDTLANEADFCSYRRATLRGEQNYGRQLSVISINNSHAD